jgi:CTP:molybdopterin cytidylyltransferase MocA
MAASVRLGRRAIDPASTAVLICLSFHPLVSAGTVAAIASTHHVSSDSIVIPSYHGRRDHPTLFPWPVIEDIFRGTTLRQVIVAHAEKVRLAEVDDEGVFSTWTHRKTTNG